MNLATPQLCVTLSGMALAVLLSGCGVVGGAVLSGALMGSAFSSQKPSPPRILCAEKDSIGIRYGVAGSSVARDEAEQLISEHCEYGYVETHRKRSISTSDVYAACFQVDGSPVPSPSCKYVAPEQSPTGFGNYDPAAIDG